jgi:hypothetical protein
LEKRIGDLGPRLPMFAPGLRLALGYVPTDPQSSLTKSRAILEKLVVGLYSAEMGREPRKALLGDMLADNQFTRTIARRILSRMNAVRDLGNLGPHGEPVQPSDAARVLDDLCEVLEWYLSRRPGGEGAAGLAPAAAGDPGRTALRAGRPRAVVLLLITLALVVTSAAIAAGVSARIHDAARATDQPRIEVTPPEEVPNPDADR